ncbi:MAG: PAS domain-containing protein [Gammaproteobacteria bacterium]
MDQELPISFLRGGGSTGAFIRAFDWPGSPLGHPAHWPQSLRTMVRLLLNTEHPMQLLWGDSLICIYNEAFRTLLGPDRHPAALGAPAQRAWNDVWDVFGPRIEHVMNGHGATWDEAQPLPISRSADDAVTCWTYSLSPVDEEAAPGGIGGVLMVCTDVGAQIAAHAALEAERARLLAVFEQAPGFLAVASGPEHTVEMANAAYRHLVGERDLVGKPVREALPELAGQGFFEMLDEVYRSGRPCVGEAMPILLQREADGPAEQRYINFIYAPVRTPRGEITGLLTEGHDVTELKRTEDELRTALHDNEVIFANSRDMLCMLDIEGRYVRISASAAGLLGYAPDELIGRNCLDLAHPADLERTRGALRDILTGHPTSAFENRCIRKDGTIAPLLWSAVWAPEQRKIIAVARDLSERLQAEATLHQAQNIELIGRLAGGIAHDFNNLLTVILGNSDLLVSELVDHPELRELAEMTHTAAERGADLTRRLLTIGRQQTLAPQPVDVAALLARGRAFLGRVLPENITLEVRSAIGSQMAWVDPAQLENAVLNLCINARDAMPDGGHLTIEVQSVEVAPDRFATTSDQAPGAYVRITVSDSGSGMDPDTIANAFEPFFTTKDHGRGSGLGLAMVQGFARQSGGVARLRSMPGQGTSVELYLPRNAGRFRP